MEVLSILALHLVDNIGGTKAKQLISYCGSAEAVFKMPLERLKRIPQIGEKAAQALKTGNFREEAEAEWQKAAKMGVRVLSFLDPDYPQRLRQIPDAPLILFTRGEVSLNPAKCIAIVGTREATDYGRGITEEIVADLQKHKPLIVSGLAYGIDIAAHRASLRSQLPTVGILASGVDVIYPAAHKQTVQQMLEAGGGIVSESRLGTKPDAPRFPARNRIIAGMADLVLVIEAKAKGGALITAEVANDYHREVMAVPGDLHRSASVGCHKLIREHKAHIYTGLADLETLLNWQDQHPTQTQPRQLPLAYHMDTLDETEQKIIRLLTQTGESVGIDDISWQLQLSASQVNAALFNLELTGWIKAQPGKKYKRV
ncbi:MAG: DNA-protecting protein DprA [Microscillaceae bacterium]|nr:DNA-protecting protein DprA [Microscillaceae bacterium]